MKMQINPNIFKKMKNFSKQAHLLLFAGQKHHLPKFYQPN
jgi:hypothetical protein